MPVSWYIEMAAGRFQDEYNIKIATMEKLWELGIPYFSDWSAALVAKSKASQCHVSHDFHKSVQGLRFIQRRQYPVLL